MLESDRILAFVRGVPQIVPESWCLECKICCRFPDTRNVQTPRWSQVEAAWARPAPLRGQAGGEPGWFESRPGSPSLAPRLEGCPSGGYRCPAFEPGTNRCSIHEVKPLDCRLYPFVLAESPGGEQAVLAMDTKCPYVQAHGSDPELAAYAARLAQYLEQPVAEEYLRLNPEIIGPFWPEYLSVATFAPGQKRITQGRRNPPHRALLPLSAEDRARLRALLHKASRATSRWSLGALLGWEDLLRVWWAPLGEGMGIFAEQSGAVFMPVPPIAEDCTPQVLEAAWRLLQEANGGSEVSRIEGVEAMDRVLFESAGFRLEPAEPEYLYRTSDLAHLRGDRYRSQRWAINRCRRTAPCRYRPFREQDLAPCLQLYTAWAIGRQREHSDPHARRLIRDSLYFHRRLMMEGERLGVAGRVLEGASGLLAYSFGGPLSDEVFCIFLEIADRRVPGAAQLLFREFCREMEGFPILNAMGDEGLEGLRRAKLGYRPTGQVRLFTARRVKK